MNEIETNIYPILNTSDLDCRCDVYEVRNLRRAVATLDAAHQRSRAQSVGRFTLRLA
jgi:hypothetical protein